MQSRVPTFCFLGALSAAWAPVLLLAALAAAAPPPGAQLPAELQRQLDSLPDATTRIDLLRSELAKEPDDHALLFALGNQLFDQGKLDEALTHLKKVTELKPEFIGGFINLGSVYDELGQLDQALQSYEKALALDPKDEKTLCNVGGVYFKKRQIEKALQSFQQALANNPKSQLAHYNIAILFADAGIFREAEAEWKKAVDIDPNSDLGQRSADNIKIIRDMMSAEVPQLPAGESAPAQGAPPKNASSGG